MTMVADSELSDAPPATDRPGYSLNELGRRGWTRSMIRRFLGEPDFSMPNPYYMSGAPMRLYDRARVGAIEQTHEFFDAHIKAVRRSFGA